MVPSRIGSGLTEYLTELAQRMVCDVMPFYHGGPGIWYDRRRDDHSTEPRQDGNLQPLYFEMPWESSKIEIAWDGLCKYDLAT
ncbi:DUF6298 domain-containing protein [Cerasicoccus arenae]|uniref:DUF6298 domain-containing protein n=1 Tax=Cerasicoccus arenae TaxID=424488 RepID=UPI0035E481B9